MVCQPSQDTRKALARLCRADRCVGCGACSAACPAALDPSAAVQECWLTAAGKSGFAQGRSLERRSDKKAASFGRRGWSARLPAAPRRKNPRNAKSENLRRHTAGHHAVIPYADKISREKAAGAPGIDDHILRSGAVPDKQTIEPDLPYRCNHEHGFSPPVPLYAAGTGNDLQELGSPSFINAPPRGQAF